MSAISKCPSSFFLSHIRSLPFPLLFFLPIFIILRFLKGETKQTNKQNVAGNFRVARGVGFVAARVVQQRAEFEIRGLRLVDFRGRVAVGVARGQT